MSVAILTIDPSFPAIIPGIFVWKTGYSRAARGHSRTVTFGFDALLGLALSHVFYSHILYVSVWVSSPIDSFPSMETREFWPFENICKFLPSTASSQAKATLHPENLFKRLTASSIPTRDASKESNLGKSSVPHRLALSSFDSLAKIGDSIVVAANSHVKPSTSLIGACIRCITECACVLMREVGLI
ncbi:hypothetical protein CMV_029345 [Castanea mollissima]|uniref:Uncharacterized protein n=2 Tax=Castanea mollissima TaxID=60419 RepID=A0A8J4Q398_9ROSI|nr:hypothetical protein CMV_029345 [Castanea mollissima]